MKLLDSHGIHDRLARAGRRATRRAGAGSQYGDQGGGRADPPRLPEEGTLPPDLRFARTSGGWVLLPREGWARLLGVSKAQGLVNFPHGPAPRDCRRAEGSPETPPGFRCRNHGRSKGSTESKTGGGAFVTTDAEFQAPGSVPPSGGSRPDRCDGSNSRRGHGTGWIALGPAAPGQQERKQAEKCIARHAHLPGASGVLGVALPSAAARRGGPREAQALGRARPDMGNQNQNGPGCKNPDSMSGIDAAGISTGIVGRASLRLMAAPPTFVRSSSCVWSSIRSAIQVPRNGNRAELRVRLHPFGFIDRLDATANLNSGDENNEAQYFPNEQVL